MDNRMNDSPFISIEEAAKTLGVAPRTVARWADAGKIGVQTDPSGQKLYNIHTLSLPQAPPPPVSSLHKPVVFPKPPAWLPEVLAGLGIAAAAGGLLLIGFVLLHNNPVFHSKTGSSLSKSSPKQTKQLAQIPNLNGQVLGIQSDTANLVQKISAIIMAPFSLLSQKQTNPANPPSDQRIEEAFNQLNQLNARVNQLSQSQIENAATPAATYITYSQNPDNLTTGRIKSTDAFIGGSVIDSYGNIYPARTIFDQGDRSSLGTPNNRFFGLYANRFDLDSGGNVKVYGQTTLGDSPVDYIKLQGRVSTDIIPSGTGTISLGSGDFFFKNFFVNNITADVGGFSRLSVVNVTSSLIPSVDNSFDLGSSSLRWRNFFLGTDASIAGNVGIGGSLVVTGNVGIGKSLTVTGLSTLSGGLATPTIFDTSLNIGSIVFAGANGLLTQNNAVFFWDNTNTRLGIGTSAPSQIFQVNTSSTNPFVVTAGGNVGIGTTSPANSLAVTGNVGIGPSSSSSNLSSGTSLATDGNVGIGTTTTNSSLSVSGNAHIGSVRQGVSAPANGLFVDGNVGIGATTSTNKLDVWGNVGIGQSLSVTNNIDAFSIKLTGFSDLEGNVGIGQSLNVTSVSSLLGGLKVNGFSDLTGNVGVGTSLNVTSVGSLGSLRVAGFSDLAGNVGIGASLTTTGLATFNGGLVTGRISDTGLTQGSIIFAGGNGLLSQNNASFFWDNTNTRLGLGTNSSGSTLGVNGNAGIGTYSTLATPSNGLAVSGNVGIGITTANSSLSVSGNAHIGSLYQGVSAPTNGLIVDGNVGIGWTSPNAALDVNGNIRDQGQKAATGTPYICIDTNGQLTKSAAVCSGTDVVEYYPFTDDVDEGDLVSTSSISNPVSDLPYSPYLGQKSQTKYDSAVIGIRSSIHEEDVSGGAKKKADNYHLLALAGRVPVKVSSENGPIQIGDYLTSSSVPGVAMKATRPGPTIGKALQAYDNPDPTVSGKILILINISYADPNNFFASFTMDSDGNLIIPKIKTGSLIVDPKVAQVNPPKPTGQVAGVSASPTPSPSDSLAAQLEASASSQVNSNQANLNLTPPDILLASGSAQLANITVKEDADIGGKLTAYDTEIKDEFKVLGETTLGHTVIAGTLAVDGTFSVDNGSEINVVDTLYLQKSTFAKKIDLFNGKVVVDAGGNITTSGEVAAAAVTTNHLTISNSPVASSSASVAPTIGSGKITKGELSTVVASTAVNSNSKIFITPRTKIGSQSLVVDLVTNGGGFEVTLDHTISEDTNFDWWIVDSK